MAAAQHTAATTSGSAWPRISGPPRADVVEVLAAVGVGDPAPEADAMNSGSPPTLRKARTGELTPAGISRQARR